MVNVLNSYSFSIFKTSFPTLLNDVIVKLLFMGLIVIYSFGIIPLQILSYYLAIKKNANPDYPRNLAKSVTVK